LTGTPIKTFSLGFAHPPYDESTFARAAARHFHAAHVCEVVHDDALDLLPVLVRHFDEPFADSSMIPTYLVSRLARQSVNTVLSGDGGDQVFTGPHPHLYAYRQYFFESLVPSPLHSIPRRLAAELPRTAKVKPYL